MDWNGRFKRASIQKKRQRLQGGVDVAIQQHQGRPEQGVPGPRVEDSEIRGVREVDPTNYLESCGFIVKCDGVRHLSVQTSGGDEIYRITCKPDGHWVWCDIYGQAGGDNIALVKDIEPGTSFPDAVYRLRGGAGVISPVSHQRPEQPKACRPKVPAQQQVHVEAGRKYLQGRGISLAMIKRAEECKFVRYCRNGLLFLGFDEGGAVRSVTKRCIVQEQDADGRIFTKRDFCGTNKDYPPILPGDPARVEIVEGGVSALAVQDRARRLGQAPPTVICTGGVTVLSCFDGSQARQMLTDARQITFYGENESSQEKQARTDAWRKKRRERVAEICGFSPDTPHRIRVTYPPKGCSDVADWHLLKQQQQIEEQRKRPPQQDQASKTKRRGGFER